MKPVVIKGDSVFEVAEDLAKTQKTKEALDRFFDKGVPWSIKLEEAKEVLKKELGIYEEKR